MQPMRIGELARHSNTSTETLRFYESEGLLPQPKRLPNGYRDYPQETLQRIHFIQQAKAVGFTLREIQDLLSIQVEKDQHTCEEVKNLTRAKLDEIDQKLSQLTRIREALQLIHVRCCGGSESAAQCSILSALESTQQAAQMTPEKTHD